MRPVIPDDLFTGPTVEIPSGLAADSLNTLAGQADYLRRVAAWLRDQRQVTRAEAVRLAAGCDETAGRLEQTFTALSFGRVRPGDVTLRSIDDHDDNHEESPEEAPAPASAVPVRGMQAGGVYGHREAVRS